MVSDRPAPESADFKPAAADEKVPFERPVSDTSNLYSPEMELYQGANRSLNSMDLQSLDVELSALEATGDFVAEEKSDGHYSTLFNTSDAGPEFYSRNRRRQASPDLEQLRLPRGLILAGELGVGTPAALKRRSELGHEFFVAHRILQTPDDLLHIYPRNAAAFTEIQQRQLLEDIWQEFGQATSARIQLVRRYESNFAFHYRRVLNDGGEGLILKSISSKVDTTFKPDSRSPNWIKVKKTMTFDMVIMSITPSNATSFQRANMAGSINCGMFVNGSLLSMTSVGTMDHATRLVLGTAPESFIGRVVEIGAFGQFDFGALRHPWFIKFREDKDESECVWSGR